MERATSRSIVVIVKFCSVSSDHVLEALLNTTVDLDSLELDSVLQDKWIKEVVTRSGMKFRWANLSASKEKINRDAKPRYVCQISGADGQ